MNDDYDDGDDDDNHLIALCILLPITVSAHSYGSCDDIYATLSIAFHYGNKISEFYFLWCCKLICANRKLNLHLFKHHLRNGGQSDNNGNFAKLVYFDKTAAN